jgi:hypothetical protein
VLKLFFNCIAGELIFLQQPGPGSASTSHNITPLPAPKDITRRRARKEITPHHAKKLAARLAKELARLDSLQIRTRMLYDKMLMLSHA